MEQNLLRAITAKMKKFRVETRTDLGFDGLTTFRTGGKICVTVFPDNRRKLVRVLRFLHKANVPVIVLGRGSNVLASDAPFDGVVVVTTKVRSFSLCGRRVRADCGVSTVALANQLASNGLHGGEFLGCLPATVGGAVVGNAGCFGQCVADVLRSVTVLDGCRVRRLSVLRCRFGKRTSLFKESAMVVLSARFRFMRSNKQQVQREMARMRQSKAQTQPLDARSAGCVLFHPTVSVSRLIDELGLKGSRLGGAQVSCKHAGFVLNVDNATSLDIYLLIRHLQAALWRSYGIAAQTEVRLIGFGQDDIFAEGKS